MDTIKGYNVLNTLKEGGRIVIYRGNRRKDEKPVVIKTLNQEYPSVIELTHLTYEYELLKKLNSQLKNKHLPPAVLEPVSLEKNKNSLAIIFENFDGELISDILKNKKFKLVDFLEVAISITSSIEVIHDNHIIHKDIKPSNIIINQETKEVRLIDFGLASQLNSEYQSVKNPNFLEGTLIYMSPEQTGRMNRSIDYRTDFYSLGITLYEMLTGELPFQFSDPIEMVHCHIAKNPPSPHDLDQDIPDVISNIIMKLLSKTAEDRYQTAFGLKADLENCLIQLVSNSSISDFIVGQEDLSSQFKVPQKLYGREKEVSALMAAFDQVSQSKTEMVLVAGYSGIGKSALVHEINQPIVCQRGFFIEGKFDQFQRDIPYSALIQAFQELVRQLLTESEEKINVWHEKLLEALGSNGQVIIDVIPEVELIVGPQPSVSQLDATSAQNRFNLVFQKFINVFTKPDHPLVIFLDDLQWADSASLKFIQLIMTDIDSQYLLLIGAYRDNEVNNSHPLVLALDELREAKSTIKTITIKPLKLTDICELITDTLHCDSSRAMPLATLCLQKTNGNPFFINQLFQSLHSEGLLVFNLQQRIWVWEIEDIQDIGITDNVVDLMIAKIKKFPKRTQELLKLAACIGNKFNLEVLSIVDENSPSETALGLWKAIQENLILPQSNDYKAPLFLDQDLKELPPDSLLIKYKFLHDRVQQAAYALIPESDKAETHLKIGRLRLSSTKKKEIEEKVFDIVNHLNMGSVLMTDRDEIHELTQLNLMAGRKAKTSTAYEAALRYFTMGIGIWQGDIWQDDYDLAFALYRERSECEYLCGNFDQAEDLFDIILNHINTHLEKADIQNIRLALYDNTGKYLENLKVGSEALKSLGLIIPTEQDKILEELEHDLNIYRGYLEQINISDLIDSPKMSNPEIETCMQLLMNMTGPAYFTDQDLLALTTLKMVNLSIEHGNSEVSAHGYAFWGIIAGSRLVDYVSGYEFGQLALKLNEKYLNSNLTCKVFNLFGGLISLWRKNIRDSITILRKGYQAGVEAGDVYVSYNSYHLILQRIIANDPFDSVLEESNKHLDFLNKTKNHVFVGIQELYQHFIFNLQGLTNNKFSFSDNNYDELECVKMWQENLFLPGVATYNIFKSQILFLYEDYENALIMAEESQDKLAFVSGIANQPEHYFFYSLTLTSLYPSTSKKNQKKYWKILEENQNKIKLWAENCPDNFLHKYLLVEAEISRISDKDIEAIDLYDQAIESARKYEFIQSEAIANELTAKFWLSRGNIKIAKIYMVEAHYCYHRWGAECKVSDLEERYPRLLTEPVKTEASSYNPTYTSTSNNSSGNLDLATVIKASQALAGEIILSKLLSQLMKIAIENAGAQKGFLILDKDGQWVIEAEGEVDSEAVTILQSIPITALNPGSHVPLLSAAIINYVANTSESIVLNHASLEGKFIHDPYVMVAQPKSILCAPLINLGKLSGILYLENNLTASAFTPERLEVLTLLSSQAAISIENAKLYASMTKLNQNLKEEIAERVRAEYALAEANRTLEQKVDERTHKLSETLQQLKATQAHIITQEKLASLGSLTAGIAHEIKNPLNFVNNFAELSIDLVGDLLVELGAYKDNFGKDDRDYIEEILSDLNHNAKKINEHGKRADKIVRGMLMHSRGSKGEHQISDINDLLDQSANLAYHGMRVDHSDIQITINTNYDHTLPKVSLVAQNISRAFLNIINNACYAVQERKQISDETYVPSIWISTNDSDQYVEIHVRDNGNGISDQVIDKIFNPFFTTKGAGEGTGLGLSICHDIITQEHQGKLELDTKEGCYTEFIISLPKKISLL